jgi:predicted ABC-type transport system involved in lysophospholipase L1 biosynthesis ATPase subunit
VLVERTHGTGMKRTIIVSAVDLSRTFGKGETTVQALVRVSIDFPTGGFTAVMGPSGSGKSTMMHLLAGLDSPISGSVAVDGTELSGLDEAALTRLRRDKLGFVFQGYNLVQVLNAEENILLPLTLAGLEPDLERYRELVSAVGIGDRLTHGRQNFPVASSSASRSLGRSSVSRRWSSPTNRRATSTRSRQPRCWTSCGVPRTTSVDDHHGHSRG